MEVFSGIGYRRNKSAGMVVVSLKKALDSLDAPGGATASDAIEGSGFASSAAAT